MQPASQTHLISEKMSSPRLTVFHVRHRGTAKLLFYMSKWLGTDFPVNGGKGQLH